jgi:hypothetical protein
MGPRRPAAEAFDHSADHSNPRFVPAAVANVPERDSAPQAAPAARSECEVVADSTPQAARGPRSQRELVAASLVHCPPRDGRLPGKLTR